MEADFRWIETTWSSPIMVVILVSSVVTLGFILERAIYFWKRRGSPNLTLKKTLEQVRSRDLKAALWTCENTLHPMGSVAAELLKNPDLTADEAEEKLHVGLSEERLRLERNLGVIGTVGSIAPLVGLLGTVWGIMRAFNDMATTGSAGPSVVAAGVAEALLTTAAGLIVAVPAVALFNHFHRRTHVLLTEAENHARTIRMTLVKTRSEHHSLDRAA